ncbi:MAG: hypothetical protein IKN67_03425 [Alphaproteobacteria bacterium]|nr:hypothetical protein [Alphaproteobacteria bacterium]
MEQTKVKQILDELKSAYPKYDISSCLTQQRGDRYLIIVKGFDDVGDIDDWSVDTVYPIWWNMVHILETHEEAMRDLRLLFIRNNQFMLHSPDVGLGSVFKEFKKPLHKEVYGDYAHMHYIGECQDINDVLDYLTQTHVWF